MTSAAPCPSPWNVSNLTYKRPHRPIPGPHGRGSAPTGGANAATPREVPRRRPSPSSRADARTHRQAPLHAAMKDNGQGAYHRAQHEHSTASSPTRGKRPPLPSPQAARVVPTAHSAVGKRRVGGWIFTPSHLGGRGKASHCIIGRGLFALRLLACLKLAFGLGLRPCTVTMAVACSNRRARTGTSYCCSIRVCNFPILSRPIYARYGDVCYTFRILKFHFVL
jgi:hypothetical protein